jgi:hypothetical protein
MSATPVLAGDHPPLVRWYESRETWWFLALRFLPAFALLNLAWEVAQLPLYTIYTTGSASEIAFAVIHCTMGDVLIGATTLAAALVVTRAGPVAVWRFIPIAAVATALGIGYTVFSEWLNVEIRRSWAYADLMPVVPGAGTGLAPLAQWLLLPGLALAIALGSRSWSGPDR